MMEINRPNHNGVYVGRIEDIGKSTISFITKEELFSQDILELRTPNEDIVLTVPRGIDKGKRVTLNASRISRLKKGLEIYRMKSPALIASLWEDLNANNKVLLKGNVRFISGEPVSLRLSDIYNRVEVLATGDVVLEAKTQPVTKEQLKKNLGQLGDTNYAMAELSCDMGENGFLPVKAIKELRRSAISAYKDKLAQLYHREYNKDLPASFLPSDKRPVVIFDDGFKNIGLLKYKNKPILEVEVHKKEQLLTALSHKEIDRIAMDMTLWKQCKNIDRGGKQWLISMPIMFRGNSMSDMDFREIASGADGILVYTIDSLSYIISKDELVGKLLIKQGKGNVEVILENTLYAYNSSALRFWQQALNRTEHLTFGGMVCPSELTLNELLQVKYKGLIVPIYGRRNVMSSVQCVKKTLGLCDKRHSTEYLTDRVGTEWISTSICEYCYSCLWEKEPLSLSGHVSDVQMLNPAVLRLSFLTEAADEMEQIINNLTGEFIEGNRDIVSVKGHTGRFYKGIE